MLNMATHYCCRSSYTFPNYIGRIYTEIQACTRLCRFYKRGTCADRNKKKGKLKMAKISSKRAHVLNIPSPTIEEDIISDTSKTKQETVEDTSPAVPTKSSEETGEKTDSMEEILHLSNNTEDLSMLIKYNLEKEFEGNTLDTPTTRKNSTAINSQHSSEKNDMQNPIEKNILQDETLPIDVETIPPSTNMVESIENTLVGDNIIQQCTENIAPDDTAKNDNLPDDTEAIPVCTNIKSVENTLVEDNITQDTESIANETNTVISTPDNSVNNKNDDTKKNNLYNNKHEAIENTSFYTTNVFETIVKECVLDYLHRFNVCTCDRCIADVTALALTNLPSKYIVTDYENVAPLIHFLEHKHEVILMTELTKACLTVHSEPRHKIK